jgi:hypothetical protein
MDDISLIGMVSIIVAGFTIAIGSIGPALGEGRALSQALNAMAQQPDEADTITGAHRHLREPVLGLRDRGLSLRSSRKDSAQVCSVRTVELGPYCVLRIS